MKKTIITLLITVLSLGPTQVYSIHQNIESDKRTTITKPTESRPIRYLDHIVINTSQEFRTVCYKDEQEGVKDIRKLINQTRLEEIWAYLPQKKMWVEVGVNERTWERYGVFHSDIEWDESYIKKLMRENDEMVIYHPHPNSMSILKNYIEKRKKEGKPLTYKQIEKRRLLLSVYEARPSQFKDIPAMVKQSIWFMEIQPGGKFSHKVASNHGVTEYCLTEKGKEHFKDTYLMELELKKFKAKYPIDKDKLITIACDMLDTDYVNVTYMPD